jgi:hypothetical protein
MWDGCGRARKTDRVLGRLAACLDVRVVERYDRSRWQTAGGEAGGQTRAVAEVGGLAVGLKEEVSDGIASVIDVQRRIPNQKDEHRTHGG